MNRIQSNREEALDNKLSVLDIRKKRLYGYLDRYPTSEKLKAEIKRVETGIEETQEELKEEQESNNQNAPTSLK